MIVRELAEHDEEAFLKGAGEWPTADLSWHSFEWRPGVSYTWLLERLRKNSANIEVPPQFVPSTMLYGFVNGEIVGRISIRHHLNDMLRERGGHVGYAVAPKFRRKGYATELMKAGLEFCRTKLGLKEILVTCADANEGSWKVIESCGGKLQDKVYDSKDQDTIRRYTIQL